MGGNLVDILGDLDSFYITLKCHHLNKKRAFTKEPKFFILFYHISQPPINYFWKPLYTMFYLFENLKYF